MALQCIRFSVCRQDASPNFSAKSLTVTLMWDCSRQFPNGNRLCSSDTDDYWGNWLLRKFKKPKLLLSPTNGLRHCLHSCPSMLSRATTEERSNHRWLQRALRSWKLSIRYKDGFIGLGTLSWNSTISKAKLCRSESLNDECSSAMRVNL